MRKRPGVAAKPTAGEAADGAARSQFGERDGEKHNVLVEDKHQGAPVGAVALEAACPVLQQADGSGSAAQARGVQSQQAGGVPAGPGGGRLREARAA